jgi:glycosyltransferase involved in cell wall biosynthesis
MSAAPLTVAWISFFPVEWLADVPEPVRRLTRGHPAPWQQVLLAELEGHPGLRLHIFALRRQFETDCHFERRGVNFHLLKTRGGWRAPTFFWLDTWLLRRALREIGPDVVHAWGVESGAALVAPRLKYPHLVTMQGLMSWIASVVPLNRYQRFIARLEKHALSRVSTVTAESAFAVQYLRRQHPRLDIHQIEHAPGWMFHQVRRQPQTDPVKFIFVGSPTHLKGVDLLFATLDRIKDGIRFELTVVCAGDDTYFQQLRPGMSAELWSRIRFCYNLTSAEVAREFATATMMLYPTRADNSPNAVKEALVAGLPVVASEIGGIPDYLFPGRNGLLFPSGDGDAFARAIRAACAHPLFRLGQVDGGALQEVREYLSPRLMAQKFLQAYHLAAGGGGE